MNETLKAGAWMMGAVASFTLMAISGRAVRVELDTFELMTYRSLVGFLIVIGVASYTGGWRQVSMRHIRRHLLRNLFHFTGQNLWFYALPLIPLAQLFALEFTTPIWVVILAPLFLGERLGPFKAVLVAVGFTGVLIVARPGMGALSGGVIAAGLCAIGFAMTAIFTKRLTQTETITSILFYLTGMQLIFGLVIGGMDGDFALLGAPLVPFMIIVGFTGLSAHFCITQALRIAPASVVMPFDFLRLPVIVVVGYLLYSEDIDMFTLIGAALILFSNYLNLRATTRAAALPTK